MATEKVTPFAYAVPAPFNANRPRPVTTTSIFDGAQPAASR
jgi:hypothetical protein